MKRREMKRRSALLACTLTVGAAASCKSSPTFLRPGAPGVVVGSARGSDLVVQWSEVEGASGYTIHVMNTAGEPMYTNSAPATSPIGAGEHLIGAPPGFSSPELFVGVLVSVSARFGNGETEPSAPIRIASFPAPMTPLPVEKIVGDVIGDRFGAAIASGDFDRDGFDDLAIGAPIAGKVYIHWGTPVGVAADPLQVFEGTPGDRFGAAIASGDLTGDGFDDLVVGAPLGGGSGRIHVFQGSMAHVLAPGPVVDAPAGALEFGAAVAIGNDAIADSAADVLVGAPGSAMGGVFVFPVISDVLSGTATSTRAGASAGGGYGAAVAAAGDVDGDGLGDFIVGEPSHLANAGRIEIVFGYGASPIVQELVGESGGKLGTSVAAGLLDDDDRMDLVAGEPGFVRSLPEAQRYGRLRVLLGAPGQMAIAVPTPAPGDVQSRLPEGDRMNASFGAAVVVIGDVDRDGFGDTLTGSPTQTEERTTATLQTTNLFPIQEIPYELQDSGWLPIGPAPTAEFGFAVAGMDFNRTGAPDAIIGAPGDGPGSVWIFGSWPLETPRIDPSPPARVLAGSPVRMEGTVFSDAALPAARFLCTWSFGDATASVVVDPCSPDSIGDVSHVYAAPGTYSIRVRVESREDGRFSEAVVRAVVE